MEFLRASEVICKNNQLFGRSVECLCLEIERDLELDNIIIETLVEEKKKKIA